MQRYKVECRSILNTDRTVILFEGSAQECREVLEAIKNHQPPWNVEALKAALTVH